MIVNLKCVNYRHPPAPKNIKPKNLHEIGKEKKPSEGLSS